MLLTALAVVIGAVIGLLLPPTARHRASPRLRFLPVLAVGAAGQAVTARLDETASVTVAIASFVVLVGWAATNLHIIGMGVVTVGLVANLLVIALNGGMPVRARALVDAGVIGAREAAGVELEGFRHVADGDRLDFLGDVIAVPEIDEAISFGDVIIWVGAADVVAHLLRRRRKPAISKASPAHDWGMAPSPEPSFGSQYSASPDDSAPATVEFATSAPARQSR